MIQIIAEDIPLHEYITSYDIDAAPIISDNAFTDVSGNKVGKILGYDTKISCTLEKVPHELAEKIAAVIKKEQFEMTYTTPIKITNIFRCTRYEAKPKSSDPREKNPLMTDNITWTISISMEAVNTSGGDGL